MTDYESRALPVLPAQASGQVDTTKAFYGSLVARFFHAVHGDHMHVGYWSPSDPDDGIAMGALRFSRVLVDAVDVLGGRFLDLGCGYGGPAALLAKERGCHVTGVNIVPEQVAACRVTALRHGVQSLTHFVVGDAHRLSFPTSFFDGAWLIESISHMEHSVVLRQARRVLRPGARLYIADFPVLSNASSRDLRLVQLMSGLGRALTLEQYRELAATGGFESFEVLDVTAYTTRQTWGGYVRELKSRRGEFVTMFGERDCDHLVDVFERVADVFVRTLGYAVITLS